MNTDDQLLKLTEAVGRLEAKLDNVDKSLSGNGQPGLAQRVQELEGGQKFLWGIGTAVTALGGFVEWIIHRH